MSTFKPRAMARSTYAYDTVSNTRDGPEKQARVTESASSPKRHVRVEGKSNIKSYTPRSISNTGLLTFALLFLVLLAALLILWYLDHRIQGFPLITDNHYVWTFGPTAILTIVTSFWRLVDYHCKVLISWEELSLGPVDVEHSLLLDYISPLLPVALYKACKNRHLPVVLTIIGFLILKLIIIASTGLLLSAPVQLGPYNTSLVRTTKLDGSGYVDNIQRDISIPYTAYAVGTKGYPQAEGTTSDLIFETFQNPNNNSQANATVMAGVRSFAPKISCEAVDIFIDMDNQPFANYVLSNYLKLNFTSSKSCQSGWSNGNLIAPNPTSTYCRPRQLVPFTDWVFNCSGDQVDDTNNGPPLIIALADLRYNQTFNLSMDGVPYGNRSRSVDWSFEVSSVTAVMCRFAYTTYDQEIEYTYRSSNVRTTVRNQLEEHGTLVGFNASNLVDEFGLALESGVYMIAPTEDIYAEQPQNVLFNMMSATLDGDYYDFLNISKVNQAALEILNGIAVQIGRKWLVKADSSSLPGSVTYQEYRLRIQTLPLWLMIVGFAILFITTGFLFFARPKVLSYHNPATIGNLSHIQANSLQYETVIAAAGRNGQDAGRIALSTDRYSYTVTNGGRLQSILVHPRADGETKKNPKNLQAWWSPLALSRSFLLIMGLLTLTVIVVLQVVQYLSDRGSGFVSVRDVDGRYIVASTKFAPALVMLLLATMYSAFDFNVTLLAPFSAIKTKARTFGTLNVSLLAQTPPLALVTALRSGYWAASATTLAGFLASILTIVVSGLYTAEIAAQPFPTVLDVLDTWNTNWVNSLINDNQSTAVSSLVETDNLTYPAFTYDELVLPRLQMSATHNSTWGDTLGIVSTRVAALRAALKCQNITEHNVTMSYSSKSGHQNSVKAKLPLPQDCQKGSAYGNESYLDYTPGWQTSSNASYFGAFVDIHVGPFTPISGSEYWELALETPWDQPDNPPGCPSIAMHYGYADYNDPDNAIVTVLMCYQEIEAVETNVTFTLSESGLSVLEARPPMPDENSVRLMSSGPNNETAFWWRLSEHFDNSFKILNGTNMSGRVSEEWSEDINTNSPFFAGVLYGRTPLDIASLTDHENPQLIVDHIQKFYSRYMAQAISANMRVNLASSPQPSNPNDNTLQAVFTPSQGNLRLVQHRVPKLVLQIILALIFVLGLLAFIIGDFHDVVPWNPSTIAGVSVLLAESRMCKIKTDNKTRVSDPDPSQGSAEDDTSRNGSSIELRTFQFGLDVGESSGYRSGSEVALVERREQKESDSYEEREMLWMNSMFRLGWWKNGQFIVVNKKQSRAMIKRGAAGQEGWRYGIDIYDR